MARISNRAYQLAMSLSHDFARRDDDSYAFCVSHIMEVRDTELLTFDFPQFVPGPVFVGLGSDTDCDGTGYYAVVVRSTTLAGAESACREQWSGMTGDGIYNIVTVQDARSIIGNEAVDRLLANDAEGHGYHGYHDQWNPWVRDDSLGTVLDHSMDF